MPKYGRAITDALKGETTELRGIPQERLDWSGYTQAFTIYNRTAGGERTAAIRGIGRIIEDGTEPPAILAQLVEFAADHDLSQVTPSVERLGQMPVAQQEPVRTAVQNYQALRQLAKYRPALRGDVGAWGY